MLDSDPMEVFLEAFATGDTGTAIRNQEARGQRALVTNTVLPIKCDGCNHEQLREMGILFGKQIDTLFIEAELPKGWSKVATDHAMWSKLLDEQGRERATIFYKAAFYDRDAFMSLTKRFKCSVEPTCGWIEGHREHEWHCVVIDCGQAVWQSDERIEPEPPSKNRDDWLDWIDRREALYKLGEAWLAEHYPNWQDPLVYW